MNIKSVEIKELGNGAKFMRKNEDTKCYIKTTIVKDNEVINAIGMFDGEPYKLNPNEKVRLILL